MKKYDLVLEKVLKDIEPREEELELMKKSLKVFSEKIDKRIKKLKISAEIFVGGSFAKSTLVKKDVYDIDLFLRFNSKYKDEDLPKLAKKILKRTSGVSIVHGSRDYFKVKINSKFFIEIIPVKKVNKVKDAENITDLSYSHVKYINKKIKSKKILDDIKLAKVFCYGTRTYGAESYVHGFSGYALELLVYYYAGFVKMIRALSKEKKEKIIIDIEKLYKNKKSILMDINSAKLESPVILIDPTFKGRNALAALSEETFEIFQESCRKFLKKPSKDFFKPQKYNIEEIKEDARKNNYEFVLIKTKTKKQEGDIAGTKLLKFSKHLKYELERFFDIIDFNFEYSGKKHGITYFVLNRKKKIVFNGPSINDEKNVLKFKEEHGSTTIKDNRFFAIYTIKFNSKDFLKDWTRKNNKKIKQMYISGIKILE